MQQISHELPQCWSSGVRCAREVTVAYAVKGAKSDIVLFGAGSLWAWLAKFTHLYLSK